MHNMCCECSSKFSTGLCNGYYCQSCGRWLCVKCAVIEESQLVKTNGDYRKSPRESHEPYSPSFNGESIQSEHLAYYFESQDYGYSPLAVSSRAMTSFSVHPSPISVRRSSNRYTFWLDDITDVGAEVTNLFLCLSIKYMFFKILLSSLLLIVPS